MTQAKMTQKEITEKYNHCTGCNFLHWSSSNNNYWCIKKELAIEIQAINDKPRRLEECKQFYWSEYSWSKYPNKKT